MNWLGLVAGMAAVTYLPRMLPLVLLQKAQPPERLRRFMRLIPFAALGALIFPGIVTSTGSGHWEPAIAGALAACLLAWFRNNLMLAVAAGVGGALILNCLLQFGVSG